jgi:hypothetical protein
MEGKTLAIRARGVAMMRFSQDERLSFVIVVIFLGEISLWSPFMMGRMTFFLSLCRVRYEKINVLHSIISPYLQKCR